MACELMSPSNPGNQGDYVLYNQSKSLSAAKVLFGEKMGIPKAQPAQSASQSASQLTSQLYHCQHALMNTRMYACDHFG